MKTSHLVIAGWTLNLSLLILSTPAVGLILDDDFLAYREDYRGELSFPTNPEVDELAAGGLTGQVLFGGPLPVLTSDAAHFSIDAAVNLGQRTEVTTSQIGGDSFGLRARFANLVVSTPGHPVLAHVSAVLLPEPITGDIHSVAAFIQIEHDAFDVPFATFGLAHNALTGLGIVRESDVYQLDANTTAALLAGSSFTLEMHLRRDVLEITGSLEVGQLPVFVPGPFLPTPITTDFERAGAGLAYESFGIGVAEVDVNLLEVYIDFVTDFFVGTQTDAADAVLGDGICQSAAGQCTLRAAIQESNAVPGPGKVRMSASSNPYVLSLTGADEDAAATGDLDILDDIEIRGPQVGTLRSIIDGNGADRVFHVPSSALDTVARLSRVVIQNGHAATAANEAGGGIENYGRMTLEHCRVQDNVAKYGGGIMNRRTLTIGDCVIENNEAETIGGRAGGLAGGAFGAPGMNPTTQIYDSAIVQNLAPTIGGAEFVSADLVRIENTTISGNEDRQISFVNSDAVLQHVTIVNDSGIGLNVGSTGAAASIEITNSAFEGAPACSPTTNPAVVYTRLGNNASNDISCGFTAAGSFEGVSLELGPLAVLDESMAHSPTPSSVLIDAADSTYCLDADQVGTPRPIDSDGNGSSECEPGAIEVPEPSLVLQLAAGVLMLIGVAAGRRTRFFTGRRLGGWAVSVLTVLTSTVAQADVYIVNLTANDLADGVPGDGLCIVPGIVVFGSNGPEAACTLRAAIEEANADGNTDEIHFAAFLPLTPSGRAVITPITALPPIIHPLAIRGDTAPTYAIADLDAEPVIVLDGSLLAAAEPGLEIDSDADGSELNALAIVNFPGDGIRIDGASSTRVSGCHVGLSEGLPSGNSGDGIHVVAGSTFTGLGQRADAFLGFQGKGNVISSNVGNGVFDAGSTTSLIRNRIGTDRLGAVIVSPSSDSYGNGGWGVAANGQDLFLGGYDGRLFGAGNWVGNVISGNALGGVRQSFSAGAISFFENHVGTDAAGFADFGNGTGPGLQLEGTGATVGRLPDAITHFGPGPNVISGHQRDGIRGDSNLSGVVEILDNVVGLSVDGQNAIPNGDHGIRLEAFGGPPLNSLIRDNQIGGNGRCGIHAETDGNSIFGNVIGVGPGVGVGNGGCGISLLGVDNVVGANLSSAPTSYENLRNYIQQNGDAGILVDFSGATQNTIRANRLGANGGLGIDLAADGATANDPGDADTGPNQMMNYPEVPLGGAAWNESPGQIELFYRVDSTAVNAAYPLRIDLYTPSGLNAEPGQWVGELVYSASEAGLYQAAIVIPPAEVDFLEESEPLVATATDANGNTSEASPEFFLPEPSYAASVWIGMLGLVAIRRRRGRRLDRGGGELRTREFPATG